MEAIEEAGVPAEGQGKEGGIVVKMIWKHKEELVIELRRKVKIIHVKDKRNLKKLNTNNLHSLLTAIKPDFKPFTEENP